MGLGDVEGDAKAKTEGAGTGTVALSGTDAEQLEHTHPLFALRQLLQRAATASRHQDVLDVFSCVFCTVFTCVQLPPCYRLALLHVPPNVLSALPLSGSNALAPPSGQGEGEGEHPLSLLTWKNTFHR